MMTRSPIAQLQLQALTSIQALPPTPTTANQALQHPHWKHAMNEEYYALIENRTQSLVPPKPNMNVVQNKMGIQNQT